MLSWTVSTRMFGPMDRFLETTISAPLSSIEHLETIKKAKNKSTVEYRACCGLGHRLSKMVDAYHIARKKNYGLRVFWEFCDNKTESFHHFFGPQPLSELQNAQDGREVIKISNEAHCIEKLVRDGNSSQCKCPSDYIESSGEFYNSLVERFRYKDEVDAFRRYHRFDDHFVLGMHVRAGNGEQGDFVEKERAIHNVTSWVKSMSTILLTISRNTTNGRPPLLFLATDTASMVETFRHALRGEMEVVEYEQERPPEGSGVIFGQHGSQNMLNLTTELCQNLKSALVDMMVLTSSDVVISGRPSSFSQSLPMGVALSRDHAMYCEVAPNDRYRCYQTLHEWCCLGKSCISEEYRRVPVSDCEIPSRFIVKRPESETRSLPSPRKSRLMTTFLPYDWDQIDWDPNSV